LTRNKNDGKLRNRQGETLFIDARKMGTLVDRVHRDLTEEDIAKITDSYHAWRGDAEQSEYADVPGFCKTIPTEEIRTQGYVLTPGRYVGAEEAEDDGVPFEEKMNVLTAKLAEQFARGDELQKTIHEKLKGIGYDF